MVDGVAETPTRTLLLTLCRAGLDDRARERAGRLLDQPVDWPLLLQWANLHQVTALASRNLAEAELQSRVPAAAWDAMQEVCRTIRFDILRQSRQVAQVLETLEGAGIDALVLKGYGLADMLYGDLGLRPSEDLDLLLRPEDVGPACAALARRGFPAPPHDFVAFNLAHGYHLPLAGAQLAGRELSVELHWDLGPRGLNPMDLDNMRRRAEAFTFDGRVARRFSPEDTLLHLALHIRKHRLVGLRWLCDIADLLRVHQDRLDWAYVLDRARSAGLRTLLFTTLASSGQLLEAPVPADVLGQLRPSGLRKRVLAAVLPPDPLDVPTETDREGWTRLAALEILLLDRPGAMARELRYRLFPPPEGFLGLPGESLGAGRRLAQQVRRLVNRTATLARR